MSHFIDRSLLRLALIGALAASLGLAACGRKGPLALPPGDTLAGQTQNNSGADGKPQTPDVPKKRIPLDVLLN